MARVAYAQLGLDVVRFMPAGDPWQKRDSQVTDALHRWAMTLLASAQEKFVLADDTEILRSGPSYTIDTILGIPERCVLILGTDAALALPTWQRGEELVELVDIAVAPRPGVAISDVEVALGKPVTQLNMDPIEISSSQIRELAATGAEFHHLVPEGVWRYIESNNLYEFV